MDIYMTLQKHVDIWDIKPTSKHQNMDIHDITKTWISAISNLQVLKHQNRYVHVHVYDITSQK